MGPLLFLLFINDIPDGISGKLRLFADNCALYLHLTSDESPRCLQRDLDKLALWSTKWKLDFNPSKCCVLLITNKKAVSTIHQDCKFQCHLRFYTPSLAVLVLYFPLRLSFTPFLAFHSSTYFYIVSVSYISPKFCMLFLILSSFHQL